MEVVDCSAGDVKALADMNRMLIEDERAEISLSREQLEARMAAFLQSDYRAFLFAACGKTVGYALCDMHRAPVYLRQFFIRREERRKGYGRQAFLALLDHLDIRAVDLDVYVWNQAGIAFWESLGFEKRYCGMRYGRTPP